MASFTAVVTGNTTNASDVNQLVNAFNATTASQLNLLAVANNATVFTATYPTTPMTDQTVATYAVNGDTNPNRVAFYLRGSDTYGGILVGAGTGSITGHLYGTSTGWAITESLAIGAGLTVTGTISGAAASFSGNVAITGTLSSSGAHLAISSVIQLASGSPIQSSLSSNEQIGFGINGSTDVGISSDQHSIGISSSQGVLLKANNYFDGTNDRFWIATAAGQLLLNGDSLGLRFSSNTPSPGGTISWNSWRYL